MAPLAVKVAVAPAHMVALFTLIVGNVFTLIVVVAVFAQLFASVPVTLYVAVKVGDGLMLAVVALLFQV